VLVVGGSAGASHKTRVAIRDQQVLDDLSKFPVFGFLNPPKDRQEETSHSAPAGASERTRSGAVVAERPLPIMSGADSQVELSGAVGDTDGVSAGQFKLFIVTEIC